MTLRRTAPVAPALLALLALPACSPDSPSRPTPIDPYIGTWTGSVMETNSGAGTGRLDLVFVDRSPTGFARGTWAWTYQDASFNGRGRVQETVNGALLFQLDTPRPCETGPVDTFFAPATPEGNRLRATFTSLGRCLSGAFDLARR